MNEIFYICKHCGCLDVNVAGKTPINCSSCYSKDIVILSDKDIDTKFEYWNTPSDLGFASKANDFAYEYFGKDNLPPLFNKTIKEDKEWLKYVEKEKKWEENKKSFQHINPKYKFNSILRCPKCGSTAVTTGARGVSGFWGFIGASKTVNRCGNCGYTWKPKAR